VAKEKASTVVISVVSGSVNAKQIEVEFMNLIGADSWRWQVKSVAEGKFRMRFPTVKMASEWGRIKFLTLRNEARIMIEAWSPAVGAKGVLQSSWFRVSRIPDDQGSIRTLAKVGGLVGKVLEIDEESRFRYDFVRMRIACRDVSRVPKTVEGTLGMYVIDFEFEREVPDDGGERVLRSGIKVSEDHQPPDKKSKADMIPEKCGSNEDDTVAVHNSRLSQSTGKQVSSEVWSLPRQRSTTNPEVKSSLWQMLRKLIRILRLKIMEGEFTYLKLLKTQILIAILSLRRLLCLLMMRLDSPRNKGGSVLVNKFGLWKLKAWIRWMLTFLSAKGLLTVLVVVYLLVTNY
jgi:hypothetical protein